MEEPDPSEIQPLKDELPKVDWLFEAWIASQAISQPTKTFDRPPSFGCLIGDRGNSETASVIYSNNAPPSFTDVARRDASEIASVDQSLNEVNFEEAISAPLDFGEIYTAHDQMLLSPREVVTWNYGYQSYKVHSVMCTELMKLVDRIIDNILPELEASRPRCSSGIQSLCLLNSAICQAKLLVQNCSESSKLYLALTGDVVLSRCEKSKKLLEQSLSQIQSMVPMMLASQISLITVELREMELDLDPSEEEAGKVIRALLEEHETGTPLGKEFDDDCIRTAALKLRITSRKALWMEQRSITKLWDKLGEGDNIHLKKQVFMFFLALLEKYGESIASGHLENDNVVQN